MCASKQIESRELECVTLQMQSHILINNNNLKKASLLNNNNY